MNSTYIYRKHLRDLKLIMIYLNIFLALLIFFVSFGFVVSKNKGLVDYETFFKVLIPIIIFYMIFYSVLSYCIIRKFRRIQISLTDQGIVYINRKKQIVIPYEQIKLIEFPSIRYTGGWIKIYYPEGNIRITVVLENISELLQNLKEQIKVRNMEYVYDEKKFFNFYKTAVFSDESWSRIYRICKPMTITCLLSAIFTSVLLYNGYAIQFGEKLIFASYIMPILGYLVSEVCIGQKIKKRVDSTNFQLHQRNEEY